MCKRKLAKKKKIETGHPLKNIHDLNGKGKQLQRSQNMHMKIHSRTLQTPDAASQNGSPGLASISWSQHCKTSKHAGKKEFKWQWLKSGPGFCQWCTVVCPVGPLCLGRVSFPLFR
uniref:Uncharacterized protein n=1 Tax=Zea mays TaxID=4577 RepID=A0A804M5N4_MAIZE